MFEKIEKRIAFYRIRNYIRLCKMLASNNLVPELISQPKKGKILVLAPHMDDEVIGCGGTLYRSVLAGGDVTVVYMTDGRRGDPELEGKDISKEERRTLEDRLVDLRKKEAQIAASIIGIKDLIFLDEPDMELNAKKGNIINMVDILERIKPDVVYLPFLTDNHPDHWQTNRIFVEALKKTPLSFDCFGYEAWSPIYPNCMIDIGDAVEVKKQALEKFKSQLKHNNYINSILSLNSYRSMVHLKGEGYVEAFFAATSKEYLSLYSYLCRK